MQGTANFNDHIADTVLKDANRVFQHPAALYTTVDMFNPDPSSRKLLIEHFLLVGEQTTTWLFMRSHTCHTRERKR